MVSIWVKIQSKKKKYNSLGLQLMYCCRFTALSVCFITPLLICISPSESRMKKFGMRSRLVYSLFLWIFPFRSVFSWCFWVSALILNSRKVKISRISRQSRTEKLVGSEIITLCPSTCHLWKMFLIEMSATLAGFCDILYFLLFTKYLSGPGASDNS